MQYEHIGFEVADGIGTVTLQRPDKLNALTYDSYGELQHLTGTVSSNRDVKVLVIRGAGQSFCAGGDVHEIIGDLLEKDMRAHVEFTYMTGGLVQNLREMSQPVIAQVQGLCVGAGAVIALASDLRVLSENAKMAFLFTKVGLTGADMGAAYLLPRVVGLGRASEILLLGDTLRADDCLRMGLATRVVPEDALEDEVGKLARRLADGPTLAQHFTKRMLQRELDMDLSSAMEGESLAQALLLMGDDHREFYESWKAKRDAKWTGR